MNVVLREKRPLVLGEGERTGRSTVGRRGDGARLDEGLLRGRIRQPRRPRGEEEGVVGAVIRSCVDIYFAFVINNIITRELSSLIRE